MSDHAVLFVCLGNICRSPLAEGIFLSLLKDRGLEDQFLVDSCGTSGWHAGEPPDSRSVETARNRGVDISGQRSRQLRPDDYDRFQWLVAMDGDNEHGLRAVKPAGSSARIVRMLAYHPGPAPDHVPDPYYGGDRGFEVVADLLEVSCERLLDAILEEGAPHR